MLEGSQNILDYSYQIISAYPQRSIATLNFTEIQQFVHQTEQLVCIILGISEVGTRFAVFERGPESLLKRSGNKGEVGSDLVRNIGKEIDFRLVKFVLLGKGTSDPEKAGYTVDQTYTNHQVSQISQPGSPPGRKNHDFDFQRLVGPVSVTIGGYHFESIGTRRQVGINSRRCVYIIPVFFKPNQAVGKLISVGAFITQQRKIEGKNILIV